MKKIYLVVYVKHTLLTEAYVYAESFAQVEELILKNKGVIKSITRLGECFNYFENLEIKS